MKGQFEEAAHPMQLKLLQAGSPKLGLASTLSFSNFPCRTRVVNIPWSADF